MPPSNYTENNVQEIQHRKVRLVGNYNHQRGNKFSEIQIQDSSNEGNSVVTTLSPFTRYSSKKYSADIDENKLDKLPSTTSRGKSSENGYQVRNIYYTFSLTVFSPCLWVFWTITVQNCKTILVLLWLHKFTWPPCWYFWLQGLRQRSDAGLCQANLLPGRKHILPPVCVSPTFLDYQV